MFTGAEDWSQQSFGPLSCGVLIYHNGEVVSLALFLSIRFSSIMRGKIPSLFWGLAGQQLPPRTLDRPP